MAKGTLLYGDMDNKGDSTAASSFISMLLMASVAIHKVHLMTTGPGSFAAHEALGVYDDVSEFADTIAEEWMGCTDKAVNFVDVDPSFVGEVQKIYEYVENNRMVMGVESHIQNRIDELLGTLAKALFKLKRLS